MMKTLVIEIQKGGLGDHLFYSHLPRIAKETGAYDKVFLSTHSILRNTENKKLIWDTNPYLDGFSDEKGIFFFPETIGENENLLDNIMLLYGLDDGIRFHEPEIYFQPPINEALRDTVIYDPNFISYTGDIAKGETVKNWFKKNNISVDFQMKKLNQRYLGIKDLATIETASLTEFCSLIVSAKKIYCLTTGTATLAAALNVPVTVFYGYGLMPKYHHSKMHNYVYLGTDYGPKEFIKKWLTIFLRKFIPLGTP